MSAPSAPEPLPDVLRRVQGELVALVDASSALQSAVSAAITALAQTDPDVLREAQSLDLLGQRLSGLAIFLDALAEAAPATALVDPVAAARKVPLRDLADRLAGREPMLLERPPASDMEWFD